MIERAAAAAGLELKAHPHMLRHACGYALANKGHDTRAIQGWLGHRSITSTAVYTALAPPILFVRELGARMVCTKCGTVGVDVRPNWKKQRKF
jgi:site-specific recombinase XerD